MRVIVSILLNIVIIGLIVIFGYIGYKVYKSFNTEGVSLTQFIQPSYILSLINFNKEEEWVKFDSASFSFEHPKSWHPVRIESNASRGETVDLRVPIVFNLPRLGDDTIIGYNRKEILNNRPPKIDIEQEFIYAGRVGQKWIYKNEDNFYVYEYIIPLQNDFSVKQAVMSFSLRVESIKKDDRLEKILDRVAKSVIFKQF